MTKKYFGLVCLVVLCFGMAAPAMADVSVLCPGAANRNGSGTFTFTAVVGPLDATCGPDSAVKIDIPTEADYARLMFDSTVAGYPVGLTLGNLVGASANVIFTGASGDQPYYMLSFHDATGGLGQTLATDQILMLELQPTTLLGSTMALDPNTTLFNLYDNEGAGFYLGAGQQDTHSLAGWLALHPFLAGESLQQVRTGIGLAPGGTHSESLTVNSLEITTPSAVPEPTSLVLLLTVVGATWGIYRKQLRSRRS